MRGPACFCWVASQICSTASQICSFASQTCNFRPVIPLFMGGSENIIEYLIKSLKETLLKGFEQKILKNFCSCLYQNSQKNPRMVKR